MSHSRPLPEGGDSSYRIIAMKLLKKPRKKGPPLEVRVRQLWAMYEYYDANNSPLSLRGLQLIAIKNMLQNKRSRTKDENDLLTKAISLLEMLATNAWENYQQRKKEKQPRVVGNEIKSINEIIGLLENIQKASLALEERRNEIYAEHDNLQIVKAIMLRKKSYNTTNIQEKVVLIAKAIEALDLVYNKDEKIKCMLCEGKELHDYLSRKEDFDEIMQGIEEYINLMQKNRGEGKPITELLIAIAELHGSLSVVYHELGNLEKERNALIVAKAYLQEIAEPNVKRDDLLEEFDESINKIQENATTSYSLKR